MNFFPMHIGDYAAHTRNLSLLEDLAYRRLLDAYYLSEQPFNGSPTDVAREIGMRDQVAEVEYILGKFFEHEDGVWRNKRADLEIAKYRGKLEQASRAGRASAERRSNAGSTPVGEKATPVDKTGNGRATNHEPRTKNQSNTPQPPKGGVQRFEEFWTAWPKGERKQDKVKCARKWKASDLDAVADAILADIATKRHTEKWQTGFIEAPLVYLNGRRWEDGVTPDAKAGTAAADPESRASIEAEGERLGLGRWNEGREQWHVYRARVRDAQAGVPA